MKIDIKRNIFSTPIVTKYRETPITPQRIFQPIYYKYLRNLKARRECSVTYIYNTYTYEIHFTTKQRA